MEKFCHKLHVLGIFALFFGKNSCMESVSENKVLTPEEASQFREFKRERHERELAARLKRAIVDCSRRGAEKNALSRACALAKKYGVHAVAVSPVNVALCRRILEESAVGVICIVGGTGESLSAVKKCEAKKAFACGAREVRLVLCYSRLALGDLSYLKREIKKVKKAAKKHVLTVSLEDHSLTREEVLLGVKAAREAKADGVCVRGELGLLEAALEAGGGMRVDVSDVENVEQFNSLLRAGAFGVGTARLQEIAEELFAEAEREG